MSKIEQVKSTLERNLASKTEEEEEDGPAKGNQQVSGPGGPSHTVDEARAQGNRTDGAQGAPEGVAGKGGGVSFLRGKER